MGLWDFIVDHFMQFIHFIYGPSLQCVGRNPGSFDYANQYISNSVCYYTLKMSQEQPIALVPIPTIYEDKQEMLNGNRGSEILPPPPSVPDIQGVQSEG